MRWVVIGAGVLSMAALWWSCSGGKSGSDKDRDDYIWGVYVRPVSPGDGFLADTLIVQNWFSPGRFEVTRRLVDYRGMGKYKSTVHRLSHGQVVDSWYGMYDQRSRILRGKLRDQCLFFDPGRGLAVSYGANYFRVEY